MSEAQAHAAPATGLSNRPASTTLPATASRAARVGMVVISSLLLAACTSSLVLGTAYNAAANRAADRVKTYADFDSEQKQWIEQAFKRFQQWHRTSELPVYSGFLRNVATTLQTDQPVSRIQLDDWFNTVQTRSQRARACSPISGATGFLIDMADWQIDQLHKKLTDNRQERYDEYKEETADERRERRHDTIVTWASRSGVKLNDQQQALLKTTLSKQTSMGDRRFKLWQDWTSQFIELLRRRDTEQFPQQVQAHIDSLWDITQKNYPEEWNQNRELWMDFAQTLLNDLSADQRSALVGRLSSVADSAMTLSRKGDPAKAICYAD
jgi:hypothetical protein